MTSPLPPPRMAPADRARLRELCQPIIVDLPRSAPDPSGHRVAFHTSPGALPFYATDGSLRGVRRATPLEPSPPEPQPPAYSGGTPTRARQTILRLLSTERRERRAPAGTPHQSRSTPVARRPLAHNHRR